MTLTRPATQTVIDRLRRDPEFAEAIKSQIAELIESGEGATAQALARELELAASPVEKSAKT